MEGAFFENGPYRVVNNSAVGELIVNENAWTNKYNVLYIDQPIAVGFSRSKDDKNLPIDEAQVAAQFYKGLLEFYTNGCYKDPVFHSSDLYVTGESYGGKYIPNIAMEILKQNKKNENLKIPLRGISIGDPLVDPWNQLFELGKFGIENNLITFGTRLKIEIQLTLLKVQLALK